MMTTETFEEFETWIAANKWHFGIEFDGLRPGFSSPEARFLKFAYPTSPHSTAFSANLCATMASTYYDRAHFEGARLWFADEPFSSWEQAAGRVAIDRIRAGFGDLRPIQYDFVYTFRSDEIELLTAFVIFGLVLLWDIYIVTGFGDRIIHVSHDELFGIFAKDAQTVKNIRAAFSDKIIGEYER